jgi:hypothetical protein
MIGEIYCEIIRLIIAGEPAFVVADALAVKRCTWVLIETFHCANAIVIADCIGIAFGD